MRIFVALKKKLERDYIPFINSLQKLYTRGDVKNQLNNFNADVIEMLSIVSHALEDNDLQNQDAKDLVIVAKNVEDGKAWFEFQVVENKAFKEKLDKVHAKTGIAPKNLTITEKIVKAGRTQAKKQTKEGFIPWVNRVAPKTTEAIGSLGKGAATAVLGPFAGVLDMFSDVGNLGTKAYGKYSQHKQAHIATKVRAKTPPGAPVFGGSDMGSGVPFAMPSPIYPRSGSLEKMDNTSFFKFFNKGAYQAKWTKELLFVLKKMSRISGKSGSTVGEVLGAVGALSIGKKILPGLKSATGIMGVVGAGILAGYESYQAAKAAEKLKKANKAAQNALDALASFGEREIVRIKQQGGLEEYAKKRGETPRQVAMDIVNRERMAAKGKWDTRATWKKIIGVGLKQPEMEPFYDRVEALEKELLTTKAMVVAQPRSDVPSRDAMVDELKKISTNTAPKSTTAIGSSSPRNIHNSGDVLINQFLLQGLTVGGE